jgi:hypothetical protein
VKNTEQATSPPTGKQRTNECSRDFSAAFLSAQLGFGPSAFPYHTTTSLSKEKPQHKYSPLPSELRESPSALSLNIMPLCYKKRKAQNQRLNTLRTFNKQPTESKNRNKNTLRFSPNKRKAPAPYPA